MTFISWLKYRAPELATVALLAIAIAAIELRRQAIHVSPGGLEWTAAQGATYPRVMRDSSGVILVIPNRPRRIVSQTLGSDEILFGVCAGDRLAGVSDAALNSEYSNVASQVRSLSLPPASNVERIMRLRPDLVFLASYSGADMVELLRSAGIPVLRLGNFDRISGIINNIRAVSYAAGEDRCGANLAGQMRQRLQEIRAKAASHPIGPRVMLYNSSGYTAGAHTLIDEMLRLVGARNAAAEHGILGNVRIGAEAVASWQPDYLLAGAPRGAFDQVRRSLMSDPAVSASLAGHFERIIVIDNRYLLCVSQHIIQAIEELGRGLYGLKWNGNKAVQRDNG